MTKELKALERIENFLKENCHHYKQDVGYIREALITKSKKEYAGEILEEIINDGYMYCDIDDNYYITLDGQVSLSKEKLKFLKELIKNGQDTDN